MRVLLDESIPRQLAPALTGHSVTTVQKKGWAGLKNGELMSKAAVEFDAFVTGDQNLRHQQNYSSLEIGILVVAASNNRVETIISLSDRISLDLSKFRSGQVIQVSD